MDRSSIFFCTRRTNLQSVKVMSIQGLSSLCVEEWVNAKCFPKVHTFILSQGRELSFHMINLMLEHMPSLRKFGDLNSFDNDNPDRSGDMKRLANKVKDMEWDLLLIDSSQVSVAVIFLTIM